MTPRRPRVFIVNEPLKFDTEADEHVRFIDLEPASEHGDLVFLLPPGRQPADPEASLPRLRAGLADFSEDDFLMTVGDNVLVLCAAVIAAARTGGRLKVLKWVKARSRHRIVPVDLFPAANAALTGGRR